MDILIVVGLLVLAIVFLLIELFLIPGLSIAGISSIVLAAISVWYAYSHVGAVAGNITLVGAFVFSVVAIWVFIKSRALEKMSLKTNVTGTVDKINEDQIRVGDKGMSVSRLAPMGKVKVNGVVVEAKTSDEFIDQGTQIVVVEVYQTNVLVEKLSE